MKINITMLVRNRPRLTLQALTSLTTHWENGMNLTILDDRSDQETVDLLAGFNNGTRVVVIRNEEPMGTGPLRNKVVEASQALFGRGDYLYLSDNDVCFLRNWGWLLTYCYERAWHDGFRVVGGYNHPFHQPVSTIYTSDAYAIHEVNALATQSMCMRWEVYDQFGPFCQTPIDKVCQSEDVDFSLRVQKAGGKVGVVSPPVIVSTGVTNTFGEAIPGAELVRRQVPVGVICE